MKSKKNLKVEEKTKRKTPKKKSRFVLLAKNFYEKNCQNLKVGYFPSNCNVCFDIISEPKNFHEKNCHFLKVGLFPSNWKLQ